MSVMLFSWCIQGEYFSARMTFCPMDIYPCLKTVLNHQGLLIGIRSDTSIHHQHDQCVADSPPGIVLPVLN